MKAMKASYRWSVYALAALLTAGAMAWVDRPVDDLVPTVSARTPAATAAPAKAVAHRAWRAWQLPQRVFAGTEDDPFDAGEAQAAGPAPMQEARPPARPVVEAAASPPPLPFAYVGQWVENGVTVAFLSTPQGDNFAARAGATLDGSYRVERVDGEGIVLRYLPMNVTQILSFAEARAATPGSAPAPTTVTAPSADIEETN